MAGGDRERRFVFSVGQLNQYLRALLAQDGTLQDLWVRGEIADLTIHRSGHWYFTLKDEGSQLRCVMFREDAAGVGFTPAEGMAVIARGTVTIYEARGQYQLVVRELEHTGLGELYLAFECLRRKLDKEGLFAEDRKRPLPAFPRQIALLTSPQGAAVYDLLTVLRSRWPLAEVVLIPTPVSGPGAAPGIAAALGKLRLLPGVEVAILARGGGSLEELSAFNAEEVARAIAAAPVPVVTGIGHETDFTIADFVADRRAPTPTAAAALVAPDARELLSHIGRLRRAMAGQLQRSVARRRRELALVRQRPVLRLPRLLLAPSRQALDELAQALPQALARHVQNLRSRLRAACERLTALSPRAVLARGYSITRLPDGAVVRAASQLAVGGTASVLFARGSAEVEVHATHDPAPET